MFYRRLATIFAITFASASMTSAYADPAADEAAIMQRFQHWTADFNAKDSAGASDLFAPDLVYSSPEVLQGTRETICANLILAGLFQSGDDVGHWVYRLLKYCNALL